MQKRHIKTANQCQHTNIVGKYFLNYNFNNKRIRHIYKGILTRCYNKNDESYRFYGQKGIKICEEWLNNPKSFEDWSLKIVRTWGRTKMGYQISGSRGRGTPPVLGTGH